MATYFLFWRKSNFSGVNNPEPGGLFLQVLLKHHGHVKVKLCLLGRNCSCFESLWSGYITFIFFLFPREKEDNDSKCIVVNGKTLGGAAAGLAMTAGFFTVFGIFGLAFSFFGRPAISFVSPWLSLAVGTGLFLPKLAESAPGPPTWQVWGS